MSAARALRSSVSMHRAENVDRADARLSWRHRTLRSCALVRRGRRGGFRCLVKQTDWLATQCSRTWQMMSLLVNRTIMRYLGVLYLFLSCVTSRRRAR